MRKVLIFVVAIIAMVAVWGSIFYWQNLRGSEASIRSFEDCIAAGYPVAESYPRQCRVPGGENFMENIGNELEKTDLIRLNSPRPNTVIASPLVVEGEARGYWFFEASFPVRVLDGDGRELGVGVAQAQVDPADSGASWMTEDFVPFRATVEFKTPQFAAGTLVLEKDNPSGLPEYVDELRVPIKFNLEKVISIPYEPGRGRKRPPEGVCRPTGCSGEICADKDTPQFSICLWRPEYICYRDATCERQADGACGWTQTPELVSCVEKARAGE
ncbi:MAG: Gmad2 immunoglobulin-like domain-containing protein [Patescibacteria group bacterium]